MKVVIMVLAVLLGLLSIAAGAAKVTLVPEEAAFLHQFGLTDTLVIAFGLIQTLGGLALLVPRTRFYGALICAAGFTVSAGMLLATGNFSFGGVSLLPAVLAMLVAYRSFIDRPSPNPIRSDA